METIQNKLITLLLLSLGKIASILSLKARQKFGRYIGNVLKGLSKKREDITFSNIESAFPEKNITEIQAIVNSSYQNLGITLIELLTLKYLKPQEFKEIVSYDNIELLTEISARGRGMLLLSGHYGNWEYLAYSAGMYSQIPVCVIVKPQKNEFADKVLNQYRTLGNNTIVPMGNAARTIVQHLLKGETVALLADQSASDITDIFVDFFGRPAATYEAPAQLSLKFDVPIVMGFAVRNDDGKYHITLQEVNKDDLVYGKEGIKELTQRHVKILEDQIRAVPGLWAWQHRRWKYQPKK